MRRVYQPPPLSSNRERNILKKGGKRAKSRWSAVAIKKSGTIFRRRIRTNVYQFALRRSNVHFRPIRSFFLGVFGFALLLSRSYKTLTLYALVAVLMPIGDALLVVVKGGAVEVIARHILTAVFLLLTSFFLYRWTRAAAAQSLTEK